MVCIFRCFAEKLFADPGEHPASQSEYAFLSHILKDPGNERVGLECQTTFRKRPHSGKGDGSCSNSADQGKVFPHGHYSTPCAKSRFNCLYGSEFLNKNVKSDKLPGSQMHQTERTVWVDNADIKDKDEIKTFDYPQHSSALSKDNDTDTWYKHETEDTCDNTGLKSYSLHYPSTNLQSPTFMKGVNESNNENNILTSPSSSIYSNINIYSDWSTEDEYEQANHKRKLDSDYTSENCFLQPLAKFKSKYQKAQNANTNSSYTVTSRSVSNWKPDCEYNVDYSECINPNTDHRYSFDNLSSVCGSNADEAESSADLPSWCRVKYTRTRTIRILTKPAGLTEFVPRNKILSDLQPINSEKECAQPSDWDSLSENKVSIMHFYFTYTYDLTTLPIFIRLFSIIIYFRNLI